MASLSLQKWARYEPSIPGNLELPEAERFYLEVAAALPVVRFQALVEQASEAKDEATAISAVSEVVRLGKVPLVLDGVEVATLAEYLAAITAQRTMPLWNELTERLVHFNTYAGIRELFSARPSGGTASTPAPNTAPVGPQTAGR